MEGLSTGTIISYDGTTPGIMEGLNAALPVGGYTKGDLYITTDTQQIYRWDGAAWAVIFTGGGGGTITGTTALNDIPIGAGASSLTTSGIVRNSGRLFMPYNLQNGLNYTPTPPGAAVLDKDQNILAVDTTLGNVTVSANVLGMQKQLFYIKKIAGIAANTVTFKPGAGLTVDNLVQIILPLTANPCLQVIFDGATNFIVVGLYQ